jgi:predicted permease
MSNGGGSEPSSAAVRVAVRLFAMMHALLPVWYRRRHGPDAVVLFAELASDALRDHGLTGLARVLMAATFDLLRRAPAQHAAVAASAGGRGWRTLRIAESIAGFPAAMRRTLRSLFRHPAHSIAVVLTLALATGATTAIVGVADAVLLRPLPYDDPEGLFRLVGTYTGERSGSVSYPDWIDVIEGTNELSVSALSSSWSASLTGSGEPLNAPGQLVTSKYFEILGIVPALGRFFTAGEDVAGSDDVIVLGHGLWQRRFGGDTTIVGRTVMVDGAPHTVVGVGPAALPDVLPGIGAASILRPLGLVGSADAPSRGNESYQALVRLEAGVTTARADAAIDAIMAGIERAFPRTNTGQSMRLEPFREATVASVRPALMLFVGAVVVVLVIAVVNVVGLMLARAASRGRELAMRSALGAGRARIASQLAGESLLLAAVGGAVGWWIAVGATRSLVTLGAAAIPLTQMVAMDGRILAFTTAICIAAGIATGLVTGLYASSAHPGRILTEAGGARGATSGRHTSRLRQGLVIGQVALCVLLVVSASLLVRSLGRLVRVDPGFETRVVSVRLSPASGNYPDDASIQAYFGAVVERIRAVPGILAVATVGSTPLSGSQVCGTLFAEEDPQRFAGQDMCAEVRPVSPDYFDVMGIPVIGGRRFTAADDSASPYVGIVSRTTAELLWSNRDPLGRRFNTGLGERHAVVGVVPDVKQFSLDETTPPQTYLPETQWIVRSRTVVMRAGVAPEALYPALRDAVWSVDDQIPIEGMGLLSDDVARSVAAPRFRTMLVASFAMLALVLALIGLYGVVAGSVSSRRAELAIRLSLGARPSRVLGLVLSEGCRMAFAGIAIGLVAAFALTRLLANFLFGVSTTDPLAFVAAPALVLACTLVASFSPARLAMRVDPAETLRRD